jgi:hypothetical protein
MVVGLSVATKAGKFIGIMLASSWRLPRPTSHQAATCAPCTRNRFSNSISYLRRFFPGVSFSRCRAVISHAAP